MKNAGISGCFYKQKNVKIVLKFCFKNLYFFYILLFMKYQFSSELHFYKIYLQSYRFTK